MFTEEDEMSLVEMDIKVRRIETSLQILNENLENIDTQFKELKSKINVVGKFHYKFLIDNSIHSDGDSDKMISVF